MRRSRKTSKLTLLSIVGINLLFDLSLICIFWYNKEIYGE